MTTFSQIITARQELNAEYAKRKEAFVEYEKGCKAKLEKLAEYERLLCGGFDAGRIERARKIVAIAGKATDLQNGYGGNKDRRNLPDRMAAVNAAKNDLVNGYANLKVQYFGVKNYDSFGDQRCDCEYGMGPRHGSIVFSIGFTRNTRDALRAGGSLTADEIEDCLYLLSVLPQIETAEIKAA